MIKFIKVSKDIPYVIFKEKYNMALSANQENIEAICISSYSSDLNEVNARYVNLKFLDNKDFIFFTNYNSPKSKEFKSHNQITATLFWSTINVQIRMKGIIKKTTKALNREYFKNRDINKNAIAISSSQSITINSFKEIQMNYINILKGGKLVKCPDHWGGFSFKPYYFEFWEGHESRMNKRRAFKRTAKEWQETILQP